MSPGRLNIKTRLELETRVLAAALKISLKKGDLDGARLAHAELSRLMKPEGAEDLRADAVNVTKSFVDAQTNAAPTAPTTANPPVQGELVRSPIGTPRGMPQPAAYQQIETPSPEAQQDISSRDLEDRLPGESLSQSEQTPIFAGPRALDMPDVDFSLQPTETPPSQEEEQNTALPSPSLPSQPSSQSSASSAQPTASDALRRSIVNTPMRASASNMPAFRTIDENVLKSAGSSSGSDSNHIKLSESLAKIEAAMNPGAGATFSEDIAAITSIQSDAQSESAKDELGRLDHQYQGLYRLLGVSQMSPYEEIHRNFLRKVRAYIRQINLTRRPEKLELLHNLRKIWIAHDILTDPVTRTDYDFRDLGLRGDVELVVTPAPEDKQQAQQTNRTPTRIGELLQCAGLLEPAELQIACDMHKAMPEVQFGTFLVKQGFIGERDLESVLLGQKLLRAGVISVAQFQVSMELSQSRGHNIGDTLVERGYVTQDGLDKAVETIDAPPAMTSTPTPRVVDAVIPAKPEHGQGLAAAFMPRITDLVDFEPMEQSTSNSSSNALTELLGGPSSSTATPFSIFGALVAPSPPSSPPPGESFSDSSNQFSTGLHALTPTNAESAQPLAAPPPIVKTEPPMPTLNLSQAVPSWKDQLDWDSPEPTPDTSQVTNQVTEQVSHEGTNQGISTEPNQEFDREFNRKGNQEGNQESDQLSIQGSNTDLHQESNAELLRAKVIDLGHAAPSWKDQLDWDSPEETVPEPGAVKADLMAEVEIEVEVEAAAEAKSEAAAEVNSEAAVIAPPEAESVTDRTRSDAITSENAPLSIAEAGQDALASTERSRMRASHEITGDYESYTAEDGLSDAGPNNESNSNGDTASSTTGHSVAFFSDSEKEEHQTQESKHLHARESHHDDQAVLPGDDWIDIDAKVQIETTAHLQPITLDNLTIKPGRSGKKNKDKKKHK